MAPTCQLQRYKLRCFLRRCGRSRAPVQVAEHHRELPPRAAFIYQTERRRLANSPRILPPAVLSWMTSPSPAPARTSIAGKARVLPSPGQTTPPPLPPQCWSDAGASMTCRGRAPCPGNRIRLGRSRTASVQPSGHGHRWDRSLPPGVGQRFSAGRQGTTTCQHGPDEYTETDHRWRGSPVLVAASAWSYRVS
jgi:hypothetical protein